MESENLTPAGSDDHKSTEQPRAAGEGPRVEVSATAITRMMGIATVTDLKLIENRIDLLSAKMSTVTTKVDKVISMLSSIPAAADIDRLEIQLGAVKSMLREVLESLPGAASGDVAERDSAQEQSKKLREGIRSSTQSKE